MIRLAALVALFLPGVLAAADGPTAELGRRILEAGLDPEECYQVRELAFTRDDIKLYLNEGYLIFGKPVDGTRFSAVFSGDVEGGDAEVLLMPPNRSERQSLANYAGAPNLNEHFKSAVFIFTDQSYDVLMKQIRSRGEPRKSAEHGALLADQWALVVRNFAASFQIRLVKDLLSESRHPYGFFYAGVTGQKLGNFDVFHDPRAREQITAGQVAYRGNGAYFDVWTRFTARSFRNQARKDPPPDLTVNNYRIDATLEPTLQLRVITRVTVTPGPDGRRALAFDISPQMRITEALVGGVNAEVFQPDSLRSTLLRGDVNQTFLVVPPRALEAGHDYEVELRHEGAVVSDAGNGVYFVGARGSWYPNRAVQFARYDLTFRYPKELDLVATGRTIEEGSDGPWRISRRRTDALVRTAAFNLGEYERKVVTRGGYTIEVYANRRAEPALQPKPQRVIILPPTSQQRSGSPRWTVDLQFPIEIPPVRTTARLDELAYEIAGALDFMASYLGPPVLKVLTVSPIPGMFGQGFPGLIYLSTLAYLDPNQRPPRLRNESEETFFSEILHAHETAHQWWGNVVSSASDEDNWLMEALANYSALLYLEKRKGTRALDTVLGEYRNRLLSKDSNGRTVESAGPIIWGTRLLTSQTPAAWRTITYEKGSWIVHMLRRRMGDERFLAMLGQLRRRYQYRGITTDQFRRIAAEFFPPKSPDPQLEAFFDQWVYTTGIPGLKLNYSVHGKPPSVRVTGTVAQSDVDQDFSAYVPVEIQLGRGKPLVQWVRTSSDPAPFTVTLRQAPAKVVLDPNNSVLSRK